MTKFLKITLSTILALALLVVPMTVMAEEGIDYNINYEVNLVEGTNNYAIDSTVPYTVYILYPTATGDYTVTSDAKIGIVSYLDMWVQFEPTEKNVNLNEIKWSCTDLNQAIMIAVSSESSEVSISVSRKDPIVVEIPWTIYENSTTPEKLNIYDSIDFDSLDYVDFEDEKIDDAVLGNDGYYHLNDKNGPVLFANLDEELMSIYGMSSYGRVAAIYYDEDGKVVKKVDYSDAFNEYVSVLPVKNDVITSYWYPLTDDLIEMFKELGNTKNWYSGDEPWIYDSEDAWLYACYYDTDVTSLGDLDVGNNGDNANNGSDNNTNDTNGGANTNTNVNTNTDANTTANSNANSSTNTKSPSTGDSAFALAVAMLSAAAVVVSLKAKK